MASKLLRSIEKYAQYHPTSLSMQNFIEFGAQAQPRNGDAGYAACEMTSMKFLKKEIPVRLANILKELNHLPKPLLLSPSIRRITQWYEMSFEDVIAFENEEEYRDKQVEFSSTLSKIAKRHSTVVETMAEGVMEFRDLHKKDVSHNARIQYFLDRFYMSRISIRMLINQHTLLFGEESSESSTDIGCINPHCDVLRVAEDAYANARFLCEQYYLASPEIKYEIINSYTEDNATPITLVYVPSHLYYILFEVFKNAMRAVVERHQDESESIPPIHCLVCKGMEDVNIRISDKGGGIRRSQMDMLFNYLYSTAPRPSMQSGHLSAPLAGYGYGLPVSRLYARYFHGDLTVSTVEGYGTDTLVTLKLLSSEANELLPIYNSTTTKQYSNQELVADWSTRYTSRDMGRFKK
ncbi:pyruvate dehydrogenase (acetyl-transferring) kinase, mitochondrial-like isoform X2 [Watersipora subatra]